jgi:hypothetical protein
MAFNMDVLNTLSLDELEAVKIKVTAMLKERKVEVKEKAKAEKVEVKITAESMVKASIAAGQLKPGALVTFTMNGKTWTKAALKVSDKTVAVDMVGDVDTVKTMRYVHFDKIVGVVPVATEDTPEPAKAILIKKANNVQVAEAV